MPDFVGDARFVGLKLTRKSFPNWSQNLLPEKVPVRRGGPLVICDQGAVAGNILLATYAMDLFRIRRSDLSQCGSPLLWGHAIRNFLHH
jgi:hypothetical protein